ncbi:MAG: Mfa1 family fimbria major subunit [Muribaculaceae bacterium]|nr:Mfa1 family fimbria major subunit [Muribaculaceae bacterium]
MVVVLVACGSDEPGNEAPDPYDPVGDIAFIAVNIQDANVLGRATTDGGFAYGTPENESKINNAHFYFFDENGVYTELEASIWREGGMNPAYPDANVEHFGKNIIVLQGLQAVGYPKYMLTVINAPVNYHPEATLEATAKALASWGETANFMMTTTSYYGGANANHTDKYYYANVLQPENFLKQTPGSDPTASGANGGAQYVNVYVERLAVKVQVTLDASLESKTLPDGSVIYALPVTVAGGDNTNHEGSEQNVAETKLYAKFSNWGLNVTAKNSYVSKNLDGWNAETTFPAWGNTSTWNAGLFFRSFWGKSVGYGKDISEDTHNFVTYNDLSVPFAKGENAAVAAYCNENTNIPSKINTTVTEMIGGVPTQVAKVDHSKVTSVLLQAELCDENGSGLTMVLHNGVLFFEDAYVRYVLNLAGPFYTRSQNADGETVFTKYTSTAGFTCSHSDASATKVVCADPTALTGVELWKIKSTAIDLTSEDSFEPVSVDSFIAAVDAAQAGREATRYNNGAMYYNIPIGHQATVGNTIDMEGYYGVVRNHWYKLNITKIMRIGVAVNNPEEIIIPKPEIPEYYLGADINILSWKVLDQDVPLN